MKNRARSVLLLLVALPLACTPFEQRSADDGVDASVDTDTLGGIDTEAETDADTDSSSDGDSDTCDEVPEGCCTGGCSCANEYLECVWYPESEETGFEVCLFPAPSDECWNQWDCPFSTVCAGAEVCGCGLDCDTETTGDCIPSTAGCCDCYGGCPEGYFCLTAVDPPTCHAELTHPFCWTDGDCPETLDCRDETICACDESGCTAHPGDCYHTYGVPD
jgi:hypothetical protein